MGGRGYLARALMCTTSLCFLIFLLFFSLFFSLFLLLYFFFLFYALFSFFFSFLFLSFFLALLVFFFLSFLSWYTERAPTRVRVCWDSTHTGELLKRLFDVPLLKRYFFARSFCGYQSRRPVRRYWLFVWSPGSVCFSSLFLCP